MAKRRKKTNTKTSIQRLGANINAVRKFDNPHDKRFKELFGNKNCFMETSGNR